MSEQTIDPSVMVPLAWVSKTGLACDDDRQLRAGFAFGGFETTHQGQCYVSCGVAVVNGRAYAVMMPLVGDAA